MCRIYFLISVRFLKKTWIQCGMSLDWFDLKKMQFGSDITVIYYLCNSYQVIYSKYYSATAMLNE